MAYCGSVADVENSCLFFVRGGNLYLTKLSYQLFAKKKEPDLNWLVIWLVSAGAWFRITKHSRPFPSDTSLMLHKTENVI